MIYSQLPPLNSVKAFDAVVRHGSISEASRVLCVSQSAVSRHIANLEDFLGCKLLRRSKLGTETTKEGQEYFDSISSALNSILDVTTKVRALESGLNVIKLRSLSSFALRWLAPRLSDFQSTHPDIVLDISISDKRPDFATNQIDCAIVSESEYGSTKNTKNDHVLFVEELVLIASPILFKDALLKDKAFKEKEFKGRLGTSKEVINSLPFIHTSSRPELWEVFQKQLGGSDNNKAQLGLSFQDFYISIAACVAGSGITLVPSFLVRKELEDGQLIQLLDTTVTSGNRYKLAISAIKSSNSSVLALQDWLLKETSLERIHKLKKF